MPTTSRQTTQRGRWRLQLGQAMPEEDEYEVGELVERVLSLLPPPAEEDTFAPAVLEEGRGGAGGGLEEAEMLFVMDEDDEEW